MGTPTPSNFNMPKIKPYDVIFGDPCKHISLFENKLALVNDESLLCRLFPSTLESTATDWFEDLPPRCISSWKDFKEKFTERFKYNRKTIKNINHLYLVRQKPNESLTDFFRRYREEAAEVHEVSEETIAHHFKINLHKSEERFFDYLKVAKCNTMSQMVTAVTEWVKSEEETLIWKSGSGFDSPKTRPAQVTVKTEGFSKSRLEHPPRAEYPAKKQEKQKDKATNDDPRKDLTPRRQEEDFSTLSVSLEEAFKQLGKEELGVPRPMTISRAQRTAPDQFCKFHEDYGHKTQDCQSLKNRLQNRFDKGLFQHLVKSPPTSSKKAHVAATSKGYIATIFAKVDNVSNTQRKLYANHALDKIHELHKQYGLDFRNNIGIETREKANQGICFSIQDMEGVLYPHSDALVISATIHGYRVARLLIDEGSGISLLYANCWKLMQIDMDLIVRDTGEIAGFNGAVSIPVGRISLDVELAGKAVSIDFFLMEQTSPHNALLGRDWTGEMGIVGSTKYQCIKFPHFDQVVKVRSDQYLAHKCNEQRFSEATPSTLHGKSICSTSAA